MATVAALPCSVCDATRSNVIAIAIAAGALGAPRAATAPRFLCCTSHPRRTLSMKNWMPDLASLVSSSRRPRSIKPKWRAPAPKNSGTWVVAAGTRAQRAS
eukprot:359501-Chlamydomonas_euryale.AAC.3